MKKPLLIFAIAVMILAIPFSSSISSLGTFEKEEDVVLKQVCATCTYVNITSVSYPNSTKIIGPISLNKNGEEFTYVLDSNYTDKLGTYNVNGVLDPSGGVEEFGYTFEVTNAGKNFSTGEALGAVGAMFAALFTSFMFSRIGFNLGENQRYIPVSFLFIILSIVLTTYGLFLGFSFGQDIVQYAALSSLAETMFFIVMWTLVGIAILFMALMLIAFVNQLNEVVKKKKFGDDFNPVTNTYE